MSASISPRKQQFYLDHQQLQQWPLDARDLQELDQIMLQPKTPPPAYMTAESSGSRMEAWQDMPPMWVWPTMATAANYGRMSPQQPIVVVMAPPMPSHQLPPKMVVINDNIPEPRRIERVDSTIKSDSHGTDACIGVGCGVCAAALLCCTVM